MSDYKLRIDAHALFQLGEQLISDDEQALLELIKNSYDADSPSVKVRVDADYAPTDNDPVPANQPGLIEIEDEGTGMGEEMIRKSWLMVSLSFKRDLKRTRTPTPKFKRFPLGDKGLGRLGTMRLGKTLSVETRAMSDKPGMKVTFNWTDCQSGRALDEVPIITEAIPANGKTGTTVRIYALNDVSGWKAPSRITRLTTKLTGLLSPFESFRNFEITCAINGQQIDLGRVSKKLRDTATVHVDYNWDTSRLAITARVKLIWFKKKTPGYDEFIASDEGKQLFQYFGQKKNLANHRLVLSAEGGWFVEFSTERSSKDVGLAQAVEVADPGPFRGIIDYYDLGGGVDLPKDFLGEGMDYKQVVRELAQVYIYRDNFGIRMPYDWMSLGKAWTSGSGYYSLRPGTTIGYYQISVIDNPLLVEKSDREGFMENNASLGFMKLVGEIREFLNRSLNFLGKASVEFLQEKNQFHADEETSSPAAFDRTVRDLEKLLNAGQSLPGQLEKAAHDRQLVMRRAEAAMRVLTFDRAVSESIKTKAHGILKELADLEKQLTQERAATKELAEELTKNRHLAGVIRRRIDEFAERAEAFAEMVATGLSAQAAAHDVPALLQQIDGAAMLFNKAGRSGFVDPKDAVKHSETIMAANTGVKQMLDLLQPMLRGRRFAKRTAKVSELVKEYFELRGPRLRARGILWEVVSDVASDFSVTINPGRLTQVLDNLVTNSEYWLEDHWGRGSNEGRIRIEIAKPKLIYSDNGRGVSPNVEASLFELFVSGKPAGQGNGLGLFITRQLLERDNCTIFLDEERNRHERRYRFNINLSDVRSEKS